MLNDNDSDIDKFFDTDGGGHALRMGNSYRPDSEETRPDGGGGGDDERNNSLKNRSLAGDEDIILSDHFTLKFTDPTVPSQAERSHMKSPVQQVSRPIGAHTRPPGGENVHPMVWNGHDRGDANNPRNVGVCATNHRLRSLVGDGIGHNNFTPMVAPYGTSR